ncbi:MAG: restriction endonuclease subunit S [Firmicutes bacterium]|nr:restriction endonuclease subunit S [Bacillota bacterium]
MPKYKFTEIAINSTEKKKPTETDKDTYIGLEHLDSGTLTVSRWGSDVAPIGEKLIMKKGDVLFGKRRAYQKKVGIAPFDGIFSAHGMVLRPREEVITKEYFPLFISSDYFLDEAIRISVGSLSPTVNWKDLKELEFNIPTIEEQKRITPLVWAAIEAKNAYKTLVSEVDNLVKSQFIEMFLSDSDITKAPLSDVFDKPQGGEWGDDDDDGSGTPVLRTTNFTDEGYIDFSDVALRKINLEKVSKKALKKGDILIEKSGGSTDKPVGRVVFFKEDGTYLNNNFTARLHLNGKYELSQLYTFYFMFVNYWKDGTRLYEGKTTGIHNLRLMDYLQNTLIPIPLLQDQKRFEEMAVQSDKSKLTAKQIRRNQYVYRSRF